jgi:hypothetical protein
MDGYAPFAPRSPARSCVPFTACWPGDAQLVVSMSAVPPSFPMTSFFIVRRGNLTDRVLDLAWLPKDSTEQTSMQDAILTLLHERGGFYYDGQCRSSGSMQDSCWLDAVGDQFLSPSPLPGLYLSGSWCGADAISNVTLTCPCIHPGVPLALYVHIHIQIMQHDFHLSLQTTPPLSFSCVCMCLPTAVVFMRLCV